MAIKNPFGAAKKLQEETKIREQAELDLDGATTDVRLKREEIESLKTELAESSASAGRALAESTESAERSLVDVDLVVKTQAIEIEGLKQQLSEAPHRAMEELVVQRGIRIGYHDFDLINIQSAARSVESSIHIERENFRWVFYADKTLEQAQMNRLDSKLGFKLERG